jgi:hypothetical protein
MNWTIVSVGVAFFLCVFGVANYLSNSIDKQIEAKFSDPKFIKEVADKIRLPFVIFDENERVTVNSGAEEYIDSVLVTKKTITDNTVQPYKIIDTIKVKCKSFMSTSPVLQCITGRMQFYDAKRVDEKDWIFTVYHGGQFIVTESLSQGEPPPELFKLDIIPNN